ncbi:putative MFS-type transporter C18.02 [Cladobotryum mycophilum]|uniref:MFS-type transporter C18.02 n=1 Tax=Cladobotryum mycophilum TaxID=491253 RepID=A0ABR0SAC7_9HYPO
MPAFARFRSSPLLIITTISYAIFTDLFLYAVVVPVMPFTLTNRIGIPEHQVQIWVSISLAAYAGAILVGSPFCGYMADRTQNRKIPLLIGVVILVLSTLLLCLSHNIPMLLIGRIFQGLSTSVTWPVGLTLMIDTVGPERAGEAAGYVGMAYSVGLLVGPLLGGVVFSKGGYYAVFGMSFGFLAVDALLRLLILEKTNAKTLLDSASVTMTSEPGESITNESSASDNKEMNKNGKAHAKPAVRQSQPKSGPNSIWRILVRPRLLAALWGTAISATLGTCFDSTLPLFVSDTFGWGSLGAGLLFLPLILPAFAGPVVGLLSDKYGPKAFAALGFLWMTPFLVCLRFVTENTISHKVMLCGLLFGTGIGEALVFSPMAAEISWAIEMDGGTRIQTSRRRSSLASRALPPPLAADLSWRRLVPPTFVSIQNPNDASLSQAASRFFNNLQNFMEQQRIDELLERYLGLLDEYSRLREELSGLLSGVYRDIARANFAGERGMRIGDGVAAGSSGGGLKSDEEKEAGGSTINDKGAEDEAKAEETKDSDPSHNEDKSTDPPEKGPRQKKKPSNNPLHWYGLFAPPALRTAQTQSIQAVEQVIPRLVSVSAEMSGIEIEVRRARKRRAKAAVVAEKETAVIAAAEAEAAAALLDGMALQGKGEGVVSQVQAEGVEAA